MICVKSQIVPTKKFAVVRLSYDSDDYRSMRASEDAKLAAISPPISDDKPLLVLMRAGDKEAFRALHQRHARAVFFYAFSIVRESDFAEEVTQETWLTFWARRNSISPMTTSVLPWLLVTARHKSLNRLAKARKDRLSVSFDEAMATPDMTLAGVVVPVSDLVLFVESLIESMPEIDRKIYELCVRNGDSYDAAASSLGITHGSVRNRVYRIRKSLRSAIAENGE